MFTGGEWFKWFKGGELFKGGEWLDDGLFKGGGLTILSLSLYTLSVIIVIESSICLLYDINTFYSLKKHIYYTTMH